jgi:hypothetical protein
LPNLLPYSPNLPPYLPNLQPYLPNLQPYFPNYQRHLPNSFLDIHIITSNSFISNSLFRFFHICDLDINNKLNLYFED